jgi:hypothetical protein
LNLEELYKQQLKELRENPTLLHRYSIQSAKNKNYHQIERNQLLIALYNDLNANDYKIVDFLFCEENSLRQSKFELEDYEVDTLYLAAYLLTKFNHIADIWKFIDAKRTDFDSSIGFDVEYLLSFGIKETMAYIQTSDHPNKKHVLELIADENFQPLYNEDEIEEWKKYKHAYFSVYTFPIKDEVNFAFQAKEYGYLKNILPQWLGKKNEWTEEQNLTCISIATQLNLDDFLLQSLVNYNSRFENSVRIGIYEKEIHELRKKLKTNSGRDT